MSNQGAYRVLNAIRELKQALALEGIDPPKEMVFANSRDGWHLQDMMQDAGMLSATTDAMPEGTDFLGEIDGVRLRWPMHQQPVGNPALNPRGAWLSPQSTNTLVPEPKDYVSDGSTASYYELPEQARELQDLISHRNMNAQDGEIFRAIYRKGLAKHSDALRDAKKVKFYADAEVERLEKIKGEQG